MDTTTQTPKGGTMTPETQTEALKIAAELRRIIESGRVVAHPGKVLDLAKRLEGIAR